MPPRRASRAATATPTRTHPSASRASTQGNTPGRPTALETTPLPDVEAEQSFAYGSSNAKLLPQQLVAHDKMTIRQMAETLHSGIIQADKNFQVQFERAQQYGMSSSEARAARAARRSSDRDSKASTIASDQTPVRQASRRRRAIPQETTPHWLQDIGEEADSQVDLSTQKEASPQASSLSTSSHHSPSPATQMPPPAPRWEQSSMPEVDRFDQTYTRERAIHFQTTMQPPMTAWDRLTWYVASGRDLFITFWDRLRWYSSEYTLQRFWFHCSQVFKTIGRVFLFFLLGIFIASMLCNRYCQTPWSTDPARPWVSAVCRYSTLERWLGLSTTGAGTPQTRASASEIGRLIKEIKQQEKLVQSMQAKQSVTSATIDELTERQAELVKHHSDLQSKLVDAKASQATASPQSSKGRWHSSSLSPIFTRINYASPSLGAIIDPYITSPTKMKHFPFYQRLLLGSAGLKKYQSRPPIEALRPWTEGGDCWCAATAKGVNKPAGDPNLVMDGKSGGYVQLAIMLEHDIFPDEIVIEHLPLKTTPTPGTAPKDIEVWGEFGHLNQIEFAALQMGPHALKEVEWQPQLGLLGRFRYDAVANQKEGRYLQTFRLEFNQSNMDEFWMKKVVIRVMSNWGHENTCLYRVRVHGVPVHAHPGIVVGQE